MIRNLVSLLAIMTVRKGKLLCVPIDRERKNMFDLSHPLEHGVGTYPGFPVPEMSHFISFEESKSEIAEDREFAIDKISFIGGSSTYIDAPRHMSHKGGDVASLPLERLVRVPIRLIQSRPGCRTFEREDFSNTDVQGCAILLRTDWDLKWGTPEYQAGSPYLSGDAAHYLVENGAALVGIDAILIDDIDDPAERPLREAHVSLLAAGIPIIENLRGLRDLPETGAILTAVPAAVRGVGSFPVRAFAQLENAG